VAFLTLAAMRKEFAALVRSLEAPGLNKQQLRAQYENVMATMRKLELTDGAKILDSKLRTAYKQRIRFETKRLVQTEIHREYSRRKAREFLDDKSVRYVRWTLSPDHPREDICDYLAGVNKWSLGAGVYPKAAAPVPGAHPFCRCVLKPFSTTKKPKLKPNADEAYFAKQFANDERVAARIAGSRDKLARALSGEDPVDILNERRPEEYQLKTAERLDFENWLGANP